MTNFIAKPNAHGLCKLQGRVQNLKVTRSSASFVLTGKDQAKLGILAVISAMAGLDGQAATSAHYASDMEEEADFLEFDLDGQAVKGWLWRNPFKEGDVVWVAAERIDDRWESYGMARPADRMVALYPHCSRGRLAHYRNAFKWWLLGGGGCLLFVFLPISYTVAGSKMLIRQQELGGLSIVTAVAMAAMAMAAVITFSTTRQWLPFVRVAEKVFRTLGLPNPSSIDLVKSSKRQRTPKDPGEFGTFYFRC